METNINKRRCDLHEFDDVSLWQLIPNGTGLSLNYLRKLADYILLQQPDRMPSVCLLGPEGKRTLARAFLNAIAMEDIREVDARVIQQYSGLRSFFEGALTGTGLIITNAQCLPPHTHNELFSIITERRYSQYNVSSRKTEWVPMNGLVILTASVSSNNLAPILNKIDHVLHLELYTQEQRKLIVLQRIRYCGGLDYENEKALEQIVHTGNTILRDVLRLLQACIVIVRAEERTNICLDDVNRAAKLCINNH